MSGNQAYESLVVFAGKELQAMKVGYAVTNVISGFTRDNSVLACTRKHTADTRITKAQSGSVPNVLHSQAIILQRKQLSLYRSLICMKI